MPLVSRGLISTKALVAIVLLWVLSTESFGQALSIKRYNTENGLYEGYVYSLCQDDQDFLWMGTGAGVFRFDGQRFKQYGLADSLVQEFTTASFKDSQGRLWFGHFEGGLTLHEQDSFKKVVRQGVLSSPIVGISESEDGAIWVASQRSGLIRVDENMQPAVFGEDFDSKTLFSFSVNGNKLLLGTDEGLLLYSYRNGKVLFDQLVEPIGNSEVQCMFPRPGTENAYWIGTRTRGIFEYILGSGDVNHFGPEVLGGLENIYSISEQENSNVLVGTFGEGFHLFNDSDPEARLQPVNAAFPSDTALEDIVKCIFIDRYQQTWMGTYGNGLIRLAEKKFTQLDIAADTISRGVNVVFQEKNGRYWIGSQNGLYLVQQSAMKDLGYTYSLSEGLQVPAVKRFNTSDGLPSNNITAIAEDLKGDLWVGTARKGVARMPKGGDRFLPIDLPDLPLSNMINAIRPTPDGRVWIATQDGAFFHLDGLPEPRYFSTRNGLAHNNIYDIFADSKGQLWFSTHTNRVSIYDGETFNSITVTDTGEVTSINSITEGKDGTIWFGTDGSGLYSYKDDKFSRIGEADGLISNYCYHVVADPFGNIWAVHRKGFSRWMAETETVVTYLNQDYLGISEISIRSVLKDQNGDLFFSGPEGLIRHPWIPSQTRTTAPFLTLTGLEINGKKHPLASNLELPYESYRMKIGFLGLTFLEQDQVSYQYKLEGRDDEWSEVTSNNSAPFQGLRDGDYVFKLRSKSIFGNWNEEPLEFSFSIAPPFWKRWWFRILVVLAVAGAIFSYVKYRVYRLNKEKAELEAKVQERTEELRGEKKKLEVANLELEKLSLVASETDNAVFIIDKLGNLEWVNPGFTRLTGYTFDEIKNMQSGNNFLSLSTNSDIGQLIQEVVRNNASIQYESRLPSKRGEKIWVISTLTPILDEEGELRKIVIIDSNITDRKEAEEEVRKINERLEHIVEERTRQLQIENLEHIKTAEQLKATNQELDSFVYRASHDLKGPLASLLGLVNIAKAELGENETAMRYLGLMERRGERLDTILVDLIEATQVKQAQIEYKKVKPAEVVNEVLDIVRFKNTNLNVDFQVDVSEDLEVITDRKMIRAILNNYIENSAKYKDAAKEQATSFTKIELVNDEIQISVTDNGVGIPASAHENVFDMFFRASNTVDGSGLGLYIVNQAVDKLGGRVDMESEEGVGTTFKAILPNRSPADIAADQ